MNISDNKRKWLVSIAANLMLLIIALDLTIVNLALPAIAHAFNAEMPILEWVINAYVVIFAMLLVIGGKLGDIFGHRRIFSIGLGVFTIASLLGGLSPNSSILIVSRILQGIGAALAFPASAIINFAIFPKEEKAVAMGITAAIAGVGQALGPTIGGLILKFLSWPWVFFVNIPIGVIAIVLLMATCPRFILPQAKQKMNYVASLLLALSVFFLIYGLIESQHWHVRSINFISSITLSITLLLLFYLNNQKSKLQLFDLKIFLIRKYFVANIARIVMAFCSFAILFTSVLYLQNIVGVTSLKAGYLLLGMTGVWAGASPLVGILIHRYAGILKSIMLGGAGCLAISFFLFARVTATPQIWVLVVAFVCAGLGIAAMFTSTNIAALTAVPEKQLSTANSLLYLLALTGNMLGVAIGGTMLTNLSSSNLAKELLHNNIHLVGNKLSALIQISDGSYTLTKLSAYFDPSLASKLLPIATQSFLHAFSAIMWLCLILLVVVFVLCALILKNEIPINKTKYPATKIS
ncbi:MAG: MFS transporter [Gammaproteobacteria bacterium]|nr:MFS transporter [Gammaproteobacteria bacterium]